jgi:hypothetical protein
MAIRSLLSNGKKENDNDRRSEESALQVRLRGRGLPLQPLHLQELQLLSQSADAPSAGCRGCISSRTIR